MKTKLLIGKKYFKPGEKVVVGFSSGPDSVFLAECLRSVSGEKKIKVCVAHLNHMLRGRESDGDEKFAENFAAERGLPFYSEKRDVKALKIRLAVGLEEAARIARYDFFLRACAHFNSSALALGHNLDDAVETGLMRIIKGTSVDGLASIRKESVFCGVKIIRPLLNIKKSHILRYLKDKKIRFRVDRSNFDKNIIRNRIRMELIPLLRKKYNPAVYGALWRLMAGAASASDIISKEAGKKMRCCLKKNPAGAELDCRKLSGTPDAVIYSLLKTVILSMGVHPKKVSFSNLARLSDMLRSAGESRSFFLGGLVISKEGNSLYFRVRAAEKKFLKKKILLGSALKGEWFGVKTEIFKAGAGALGKIRADFKKQKIFDFNKGILSGVQYFDASKSGKYLVLRNAAAGDKYNPSGLKGRKKLQDIFVDAKVLRRRRGAIPVFCDSRGRIIFLAGYRVSEDFKITPSSRLIGKIEFLFKID
ncbi:MAG: tRNA lysidine(34) synthetase TilS [bacterium]|nr:tRNA lysidine(34) synthetase TilS [bacterium]